MWRSNWVFFGLNADRGVHRVDDGDRNVALSRFRHLTADLELFSYTSFKHRRRPVQGLLYLSSSLDHNGRLSLFRWVSFVVGYFIAERRTACCCRLCFNCSSVNATAARLRSAFPFSVSFSIYYVLNKHKHSPVPLCSVVLTVAASICSWVAVDDQ